MTIMGWVYLNSTGQIIIIIPIELRYVRWCIMMIIWEIMINYNLYKPFVYHWDISIEFSGKHPWVSIPKIIFNWDAHGFRVPQFLEPHMSSEKMRRYGYSHQRGGFNYETWVCCGEGASMNEPTMLLHCAGDSFLFNRIR